MTDPTSAFLTAISDLAPVRLGDVEGARTRRRELATLFDGGPRDVSAFDERIAGCGVRWYTPREVAPGTILFVHGGGWVAGDLDTHDGICRLLAHVSSRRLVAVDYRRPPEHEHPAAVEDVRNVMMALTDDGDDPAIAIGDSSGAHIVVESALSSEAAIRSRLAGIGLIQPACDPRLVTESWHRLATGHFLTAAAMRWYWEAYSGGASIPPLASRDLGGLPAAYLVTASLDPSADEAIELAGAFRDAGVPVIHEHLVGVPHGCLTLPGAFPAAQLCTRRLGRWAGDSIDAAMHTSGALA